MVVKSCIKDIEKGIFNPQYLISFLSNLSSIFSVYYRRVRILTVGTIIGDHTCFHTRCDRIVIKLIFYLRNFRFFSFNNNIISFNFKVVLLGSYISAESLFSVLIAVLEGLNWHSP